MSETNQTTVASTVIDEAAQQAVALSRFNSVFTLEAQTIGESIQQRVSKTGAVRVDSKGKKELAALTGLKGGDLLVHMRKVTDGLKAEMAAGFSRMASNPEWTGRSITLSKNGDTLTFSLKKVGRPVAVEKVITIADAAQLMGVKPGQEKDAMAALIELGFIDKPADKQDEAKPEGEEQPDQNNGEVRKGTEEETAKE